MMKKDILSASEAAKAHYRHLHTHPELSGEEIETARYIKRVLADLSVSPYRTTPTAAFTATSKAQKKALSWPFAPTWTPYL